MEKIFLPDIREMIYKLFLELFKNKHFQEFVNKLDEFEFVLEIKDNTIVGISEFGNEMYDSDILCLIYKRKIFKNRRELSDNHIITKRDFTTKEYANNLIALNKKLVFLEGLGVFNDLQKLIDAIYEQLNEYVEEDVFASLTVEFNINEYCFFMLENEVGSIETASVIQREISKYDFVTSIEMEDHSQRDWFRKLDKDSQTFYKAGFKLLSKIDLKDNDQLLDYSPLLLDFIKAVESEMMYLIKTNLKDIEHDAKVFANNTITCSFYKDVYKLKDYSKKIKPEFDFKPSGLTFLYYLLTYFAQPRNVTTTAKLNGFLTEKQQNEIGDMKMLLRRIKENGYIRNQLIHSLIINSKSDFEMIYIDLVLSLQLLASIK